MLDNTKAEIRARDIAKAIVKDTGVTAAALDMVLGEYIGSGATRVVYSYGPDPRYVVKIQDDETSGFDNVIEWSIWSLVENYQAEAYRDITRWFAPCKCISDNGRMLIQRKTKPINSMADLPDKIPNFFTDIKPENFGLIGKNLVCHDYADVLYRLGYLGFNKRMRSAKKAFAEFYKS